MKGKVEAEAEHADDCNVWVPTEWPGVGHLDPSRPCTCGVGEVRSAMKEDRELVALVATVIADAMFERFEANHRGDTNAPTVTDMAKRVLAALDEVKSA